VAVLRLNLANQASVRTFIDMLRQGGYPPIADIISNAGVAAPEGNEMRTRGTSRGVPTVPHQIVVHSLAPTDLIASEDEILKLFVESTR